MKKKIVAIMKQAELGIPIAELIRQVEVSEQTFYRWKKKYTGMEVDPSRSDIPQCALSEHFLPAVALT